MLTVTSNVMLTNVTGPLDFTFGDYKCCPRRRRRVSANMSGCRCRSRRPASSPSPASTSRTSPATTTQRRKAALAIRQLMRSPDVIGHIEILDLAALQALADQVNADAVAAGEADPSMRRC